VLVEVTSTIFLIIYIFFVGKVNVKDLTKKKRSALNKNDRRHQVNVDIKVSVQDTFLE
jgi:hypothetical protein